MGKRHWKVREPGGLLDKVWRGPQCFFQAAGSVHIWGCFPELHPHIFLRPYCLSPVLWRGELPQHC